MKRIYLFMLFFSMMVIGSSCCFIVNAEENADTGYLISYRVAEYNFQTDAEGNVYALIDGRKYNYRESCDISEIAGKVVDSENTLLVYEFYDNEIATAYSMDEVLFTEIETSSNVPEGIIYENGKFSKDNFELSIVIKVKLSSKFENQISYADQRKLNLVLKKLTIIPSGGANFGKNWFWEDYKEEIVEEPNAKIGANESKVYTYTVNMNDDIVYSQEEYGVEVDVTASFNNNEIDTETELIHIGNLDYQKEVVEKQKETSKAGQTVSNTAVQLGKAKGLHLAGTSWNNYFRKTQKNEIDKFIYCWIGDLITAQTIDYSDLNNKIGKKIQDKVYDILGINSDIITMSSKINASINLITTTKDGTEVLINLVSDLNNFRFGASSAVPIGVFGTVEYEIYDIKSGEQIGCTETYAIAYSDIDVFVNNLQNIAKDTIYNIGRETYGLNANKAAEAIVSGLMIKTLNANSNYFLLVNKLTREQKKIIKNISKKVVSKGLNKCNDKIFELVTTPVNGYTRSSIDCPVDVYVYDSDGNLCGSVIDNVVTINNKSVFITVVGDRKNVYVTNDDYSLELTGTDIGKMDYTVTEYKSGGEKSREIAYKDIPLEKECKYYAILPETANMSSVLYNLVDTEGNDIEPTTGQDEYEEEEIVLLYNGICGDNLTWKLYSDGKLQISGTGDMYDYPENYPEWNDYSDKIEYIIIDKGVTSIGDYAFYQCSELKYAYVSETVNKVGNGAFSQCRKFNDITFNGELESLGREAFIYCQDLRNITIPNGIKRIQFAAFGHCENLEKIKIPNGVEVIEQYSFVECLNLKEFVMPDSVTEVEWLTFQGCKNLEKIILSSKLKTIEGSLFEGCKSLKEIEIPESVESIGGSAFKDCESLSKITIPENVNSIADGLFEGCKSLQAIEVDKDNISYVSIDGILFNSSRDTLICYPASKSNLSYEILVGVKTIAFHAFDPCCNLQEITSFNDVESIEYGAFHNNIALRKIVWPMEYISEYEFSGCASLQEVILSDSIQYLPPRVFYECGSVNKVVLPYNLKNMSENFFGDEKNIKELIMRSDAPEVVEDSSTIYLNQDSFLNLYENCTLKIPKGADGYDEGVWKNFKHIETYELIISEQPGQQVPSGDDKNPGGNVTPPTGNTGTSSPVSGNTGNTGQSQKTGSAQNTNGRVLPVGTMLTDNRTNAGYVVTEAGMSVAYVKNLNKKSISAIVPSNITFGNVTYKVTSIAANAFSGCKKLKSVTIGNNVTTIGNNAFKKCTSLKKIIIPARVTTIGKNAFAGCKKLKNITVKTKVLRKIGKNAFKGINKVARIRVPKKQLKKYQKLFRKAKLSRTIKVSK